MQGVVGDQRRHRLIPLPLPAWFPARLPRPLGTRPIEWGIVARNSLRRRLLRLRHAVQSITNVESAEDDAIERFARQAVVRALRALPRRHREVLVLRYYLDCSVEQAAGLLGLSTGSVKAYASRGMRQLKALIEEQSR
jgi:RNA polymerase sigma factor (sigma-70 family)